MTYLEITDVLVRHFNNTKDKFAESIKFGRWFNVQENPSRTSL